MKAYLTKAIDALHEAKRQTEDFYEERILNQMIMELYHMEEEQSEDEKTMHVVLHNAIYDLQKGNGISIHNATQVVRNAFEGYETKNDLCDSDKGNVKIIRETIKGL